MRINANKIVWTIGPLAALVGVALTTGCLEGGGAGGADGTEGGESGDPGACGPSDVSVFGTLVHDARESTVRDSAYISLNDGANVERASGCVATVTLVVGGTRTTLQETLPSTYEAGYSEIVTGLPALALEPGAEHRLEIDLGSDGSVDVTGTVTLSEIDDFRVVRSTSSEAEFRWSDAGVVAETMYSVQASDKEDFVFPDNFATGYVEGQTSIAFGGGSEWSYFTADPPFYARIQAETTGTLTVSGRLTAWDWPLEPILSY